MMINLDGERGQEAPQIVLTPYCVRKRREERSGTLTVDDGNVGPPKRRTSTLGV